MEKSPGRIRHALVLCSVLGFVISGGTLFCLGTWEAFVGISRGESDSLYGVHDIVIGLGWAGGAVYTLLIRKDAYESDSSEVSPATCLAVGVVTLAVAIFMTSRLMWPWSEYVWMLPAFAVGWIGVGLLAIYDRHGISQVDPHDE